MRFEQDFIERVRESTNLVELISNHVQLRRTGSNYQGLCPFHNEKSPSFSVSEDKQVYHCFGCKASGNSLTFVQQVQGLTFPEAVEYLAKRAGIPLPANTVSKNQNARSILFKINGYAAKFYHDQLMQLSCDHAVWRYLEQRRITEEMVVMHKLGFAPDQWTALTDLLERQKVPLEQAEVLGLIKKRKEKDGHYDLFRNRLMFPIFSPSGQCLGFGGRVLDKEQSPKYLNSPDSPVFHKGRVFYGLNHSAKFIRSHDEVILVEGYMDWMALVSAGIENVVAVLGTAFTDDHVRLLKRYTQKALVMFDGDSPGKDAAARALPILLAGGVFTRGLLLPDQMDPDDYLKTKGREALKRLIQSAPDLFDIVTNERWLLAKGSAPGKVELLDEFGPMLASLPDARVRALYQERLANLVDVPRNLVKQSVIAKSATRPVVPTPESKKTVGVPESASKPPIFDLSRASRAEIEFLNVILFREVYLKEALESLKDEELIDAGARALFLKVREVYRQMPSKFDSLTALLTGEVRPAETITRHLSEPYASLDEDSGRKLVQDCMKRIRESHLRLQSKELVSTLRSSAGTLSTEQLEQLMNIHRNRRSLNRGS